MFLFIKKNQRTEKSKTISFSSPNYYFSTTPLSAKLKLVQESM
jgi:hypothetical protein